VQINVFLSFKTSDSSRRRSDEFSSEVGSRSSAVQTGFSVKPKPSRELYRPPVLTSSPPNLNPAAKEFAPLRLSRSFDISSRVSLLN